MSGGRAQSLLCACAVWVVIAACSRRTEPPDAHANMDPHVESAVRAVQARAASFAEKLAKGATDSTYALRPGASSGFVASHAGMRMREQFGERGATLRRAGESWHATLAGARYGCMGGELAAIAKGSPRKGSSANRAEYEGRAAGQTIQEWYSNGPLGVEQGFVLGGSPCPAAGNAEVILEVSVDGLEPMAVDETAVDLRDASGATRVRYTDFSARDASGAALSAVIGTEGQAIVLRVDVRSARFPVTLDPLAWLETSLTPSDGEGNDGFGSSVAVSGTTALVAASNSGVADGGTGPGAVYVFAGQGATWAQQSKLTASDGAAGDQFGCSVAVSGTTALVGACAKQVGSNASQGAAYVFAQSGASWTQQAEMIANDGAAKDAFGTSVSLSGTRALIGAPNKAVGANASQGAAYVFVQSGSSWTQQQDLTASGDAAAVGQFGGGVSLSGTTALVTASAESYVFVQTGTNWAQQQELDVTAGPVSLSGTEVMLGDPLGVAENGTAYIFVQAGTTWSQQAQLVASDGALLDYFGASVSISGDMALVGSSHFPYQSHILGPGAVYVFVRSGTAWTQQAELVASDSRSTGFFGESVSLSGTTALIGASGAAYIDVYGSTNGGTCGAGSDCESGFCVGGVCCDTSCTEPCQACSAAGTVGTCTSRQAGSAGDPSCAPYLCSGSGGSCPTTCSTDDQCDGTDYCEGGQCVAQQASGAACTVSRHCASASCVNGTCSGLQGNGTACSAGNQCVNGHCTDGVCCDQACDGQCQACDVPGFAGTCSQVTGAPHGARAACSGAGSACGATCSASGGPIACQLAARGTACGGTTCSGEQVVSSECDGMGTCTSGAPSPCEGNFACDPTTQACRTTCSESADCAGVFSCLHGACQPVGGSSCSGPHTSTNTTGGAGDAGSSECAPYKCNEANGKCLAACASVADCAAPNVCDAAGRCVAAPSSTTGSGGTSSGCSAAPGASTRGRGTLPAAILLLGAWRRRRRRPRAVRGGRVDS